MKPTCAFCRRVIAVIERLELEAELKDVNDENIAAELIERGGKKVTPYLVDSEAGVEMYESDDIVSHLQKTYGTSVAAVRPRVHVGGSTCVSCEG